MNINNPDIPSIEIKEFVDSLCRRIRTDNHGFFCLCDTAFPMLVIFRNDLLKKVIERTEAAGHKQLAEEFRGLLIP